MRPPYSHLPRERYPHPPLPARSYSRERRPYVRDSHFRRDERPRPHSPPPPLPPHYSRYPYPRPYSPPPLPPSSHSAYRRMPTRPPFRHNLKSDRRPKIDESVRVVENGKKLTNTPSNSDSSKPPEKAKPSIEIQKNDSMIVDKLESDVNEPSSTTSHQPATSEEREELAKKEQVVFLDIEEEEEHLMQSDNPRTASGGSSPAVEEAPEKSSRDKRRQNAHLDDRKDGSGEEKKADEGKEEIVSEPWVRYFSDKGEKYYYNKVTQETVWTLKDIAVQTPKNQRDESKNRNRYAEKRSKSLEGLPSSSESRQSRSNEKDRHESRGISKTNRTSDKRYVEKDVERKPGKIIERAVERSNRDINRDAQRQSHRQSTVAVTKVTATERRLDVERRSSRLSDVKDAQTSTDRDKRSTVPSSSVDQRAFSSRPRMIERDAYGKIRVTTNVQPVPSRSRMPRSPPSIGRHGSASYPSSRTDVQSRLRLSPPPSMPPGPPPRGFHPYEHEYNSRYAGSRRYGSPPTAPPPPPPYHSGRYGRPVDRYERYPPAPVDGPPPIHPAYEYSRSPQRSPVLHPPPRWLPRESAIDRRHPPEPFTSHHRAPPPLPSHHHHHHPSRSYR